MDTANMDQGENPLFGLGFNNSHQQHLIPEEKDANVEALMQHYLNQCLEYHESQVQKEQQQQQNKVHVVQDVHARDNETTTGTNCNNTLAPIHDLGQSQAIHDFGQSQAIRDGQSRAQAILERFQQQQQQLPQQVPDTTTTFHQPSVYRLQRETARAREALRRHRALLCNFATVARAHEKTAAVLQQQATAAQHVEAQLLLRQQQQYDLQRKQQQQYTSKGSSNTQTARHNNKKRQREQEPSDAAIYLSGLPIHACTEETIRCLFAGYGTLQRVHLYREKNNDAFKGDALLLYSTNHETDNELVETVCQQVRFHTVCVYARYIAVSRV
jgi:hypothetical protein